MRAFLGWSHIPDFEFSATDGDRSDNPWKGKHPRKSGKISVELPADDWLCHKMEKLNTRVAEGYPSRSREATGLKVDQFIRTPKESGEMVSTISDETGVKCATGKDHFQLVGFRSTP